MTTFAWEFYAFTAPQVFPAGLVRDRIRATFDYLSKVLPVRFEYLGNGTDSKLPLLTFAFQEHIQFPEQVAWCKRVTNTVCDHVIHFDPRARWDVTLWQRWFNSAQHLRTTIMHEFGHVLGIEHPHEVDSVMYANPFPTNKLDGNDLQRFKEALGAS